MSQVTNNKWNNLPNEILELIIQALASEKKDRKEINTTQ